jgi:hypothetical protein
MAVTPSRPRRFSSAIGDDAVRFSDRILIAPALGKEASRSMSAYTSFFYAGDFVHVPEQAPGVVEALEDTTIVCVSVPPHRRGRRSLALARHDHARFGREPATGTARASGGSPAEASRKARPVEIPA